VVALGARDGSPLAETWWLPGFRHGETLLPAIRGVIGENNLRLSRITGIVVGTGPGAFTGLRVGLATAKGLAVGLGLPIVGISTAAALLQAAADDLGDGAPALALLVPAGPSDRVLVHQGAASLLRAGTDPDLSTGTVIVAVDLDGRAPPEAVALGERAVAGLGKALVRLGAARLADIGGDDVAQLVPDYVTLPRGVTRVEGEVAWSRGRP
jgi:tRNA threonylcarbamoyl adenosine modification protein YeaZ